MSIRDIPTFRRSDVQTRITLSLLVLCLMIPHAVRAQLSPEASASVVTVYPGEQLYSAFGHTAIRISDPVSDIDRLYNYGTFDFDGPGFYLKFIRGQLDYRLSVAPSEPLLRHYRRLGRSTVEQRLGLTAGEVESLYRFLEINYRPENRYYRYEFFFDNCSTRPRDALEASLDSLRFNFRVDETLFTYREHLDPYLGDRPLVHLGIDIALGQPTDEIVRPYETMFLPVELLEKLERAAVMRNGERRPLVAQTDTLYWNGPHTSAAGFPWIVLLLWMGAAAALARTWHEFRSPARAPRWTYRLDAVTYGLIGLMGLVISLLAVATEHAVVDPNWNLLWAWPTHLIAGYWLWRATNPRPLRVYLALSAVVSFLTLAGWIWWPQQLPPAIIPVLLWQIARGMRYALEHRTFTIAGSALQLESSESS